MNRQIIESQKTLPETHAQASAVPEYAERIREIDARMLVLTQEIAKLEAKAQAEEIGLVPETGAINIERLIDENISPDEEKAIKLETPDSSVVATVKAEVLSELNDKTSDEKQDRASKRKKIVKTVKKVLLGILAIATFEGTTSFMPRKPDKVRAYENIRVTDLEAWEKLKLHQDEINKLNNILIINEANKNSKEKYVIVDKSAGFAHLYEGEKLISTYEVGVGKNVGDEQTRTIVEDEKVYWDAGNKETGAGIYTITHRGTYEGVPSWNMKNERGIEVPTAFHRAVSGRERFFNNKDPKDNRMSNGCLNFLAHSLNDLAQQKGFGAGSKVYILPDNPHNQFKIVDGELVFTSNEQNVNRTVRPYSPQPILLRTERKNVNENEVDFLQTLADSKGQLMNLYPTVSNDVYNELAKLAYGIFGQESSFGTYGGVRGQYGRVSDYVGAITGKNVSAGVTQVRITSVNPKIKETFNIQTTNDLFDTKKAAIATMGLLLDIYTNNIPDTQKDHWVDLTAYYYNNPKGSQKKIEADEKTDSTYVKNVKKYAEQAHVYYYQFVKK